MIGLRIKPTYMSQSKQGRVKNDAKAEYSIFKKPTYTIAEVRAIYEQDGEKYSDAEIEEIIKSLLVFHELIFQLWVNDKNKTNNLTLIKNEESSIIYPGEYRRAS